LGLREGRARVRQQDLTILRDRANLEQGLHSAGHELAITVRELANSYEQYLAYRETRAAALTNLMVQIEEGWVGRGISLNGLVAENTFDLSRPDLRPAKMGLPKPPDKEPEGPKFGEDRK